MLSESVGGFTSFGLLGSVYLLLAMSPLHDHRKEVATLVHRNNTSREIVRPGGTRRIRIKDEGYDQIKCLDQN